LKSCSPIQDLKLNNNYLTQFPQFDGLSNLTQLVIHHNSINSLFNSSLIYPNLQSLDLSYNQIITIPNGFFTNTSSKLSSINLSNNRITSIEKGAFDNLTNLEVLRLSKNRISSIPKELL
jgi:Leucine-rich repeat (LRR) protein